VTPWSVVKDEHRENRPKLRYFRYAVISFTTLIVLSLGFSLIPAEPPPPADPPFSEQARLSALQDSLDLRTVAERLSATAAAGGAANAAAVEETVTLLTLQARALLSPSDSTPTRNASAPGAPPPSGSPAPLTAATPAEETVAPTIAGLASALSASGVQRLVDAATADGGMARLLSGAGTAQLLAAERLAAAGGIATATLPHAGAGSPGAPGGPAPAAGPAASTCPSPAPGPTDTGEETTATGTADVLGKALAAAVTTEQQSIYAYQAALPRLKPEDSGAAATFLGQHQELAAAAAARSTAACSAAQAQQPGFVLDPGFLAAPGDGLRRLELAALPAYGDLIAQADGDLRIWAIGALQSAARRAAHWDGAVGPVPGVLLDQGQLPELPASPAPVATET
jgi:hypothetical protein